jgi:HK97 family phage prohead protease
MNHELRICAEKELRAEQNDSGERVLTGYAAVFDQLSVDLGGFREKIQRGAFLGSLNDDVRALWSHNSDLVLGRTRAGTLKLEEDAVGLKFRLALPDTSAGRDAFVSVSRGDVSGVSFGFDTVRDLWDKAEDMTIRTLLEVRLWEISPTPFPAYPQTDVAVRSLEQWRKQNEKPWQPSAEQLRRRLSLSELES